ncbi:hypothetical protein BC939DRAFT_452043 [Gamsiella multidivaricata]|uniref:uncharacterized protein n=1 Tax=Gamsiella multidivaricata TaxID=101098 RepID=UPI00221FE268|nr:uncharacterized protein BC939DRAFT_452043 [Gamsiella multidivaricata]KAG0366307.1 hypothetical protein BGZ54_005537 [Gamsiella multidivaricata]KAI7823179.1 hypothetical protein BC939DRAFT_452043 [Gamsiella multidivaricata]
MATCRHVSRLDLRSTLRKLTNLLGRPFERQRAFGTTASASFQGRLLFSGTQDVHNSWSTLRTRHYPASRLGTLTTNNRFSAVHGQCARQNHLQAATVDRDHNLFPSKRYPIRYTPPGPAPVGQKYQTLTLYTITPIPEDQLEDLRDEVFFQLVQFSITGRIYLAKDGVNLHLCTPVEHIKDLQSSLQQLVLDRFGKGPDGAIWNFSCEEPGERVFRKLKVAVKKQLVADGRLGMWDVQDSEPPQYLEPEEFHAQLDEVSDKTLLVDMRNHFENEVGAFKTAVKMDCTTFKQNMDLLDELLEGRSKNEEVMMVCTGGIRCSISGRYLKQKGFKDVKMLKGGITSYGRYIKSQPDKKSHFVGKNFTFDGRRGERITDDVVSSCHQCHTAHDDLTNCANTRCHLLFIQCPACRQKWANTCGPDCHEAVATGTGSALSKPYDYHAQVRPGPLLTSDIPKAA